TLENAALMMTAPSLSSSSETWTRRPEIVPPSATTLNALNMPAIHFSRRLEPRLPTQFPLRWQDGVYCDVQSRPDEPPADCQSDNAQLTPPTSIAPAGKFARKHRINPHISHVSHAFEMPARPIIRVMGPRRQE